MHLKAAAAHVTSAGSATAALSRHLWASVNPGYAPTDTSKQLSVQRADYVWDAAEVRRCAVSSAGSLKDRCLASLLGVCCPPAVAALAECSPTLFLFQPDASKHLSVQRMDCVQYPVKVQQF